MSFEDPTTPDRPTLDSGVHVRDTERAPATAWQIAMAAVLVIAILCVFFYGLTNQRQQVAGSTAPSAQATNVPSTEQQKQSVGTTGAAPKPENPPGATRQQQPQKTDAIPPGARGGGNAVQPPSAPQKNQ
jgi:hypothetical protein